MPLLNLQQPPQGVGRQSRVQAAARCKPVTSIAHWGLAMLDQQAQHGYLRARHVADSIDAWVSKGVALGNQRATEVVLDVEGHAKPVRSVSCNVQRLWMWW